MNQVRILTVVPAAGAEPDLTIFFVNLIDAADDPLAFGDLVLQLAFLAVVKIQVPPAVHFGDVNQFITVVEVMNEVAGPLCVRGPDERLALLVDQVARLAGVAVEFNKTQSLVAAIDLAIREMPAVLLPANFRIAEIDALDFGLGLLTRRDVEDAQLVRGEAVARKRVRTRGQFRPAPSLGR